MRTYPVIHFETPQLGIVEFADDQVIQAEAVQEMDPMALTLPMSTLEFTAINLNEQFTIFEPDLLPEHMPILAHEWVDGELQLLGRFFLRDWEIPSVHQVKFYAYDWIGVLENTSFDGIFWSAPIPLGTALQQVLAPIGVPFDVAEDISSSPISGWIKPSNYREALQQLCFAAGATALTQRREDIRIERVELPEKSFHMSVPNGQRVDNSKPYLADPVHHIELVSHDYAQGDEEETVFDQVLPAGQNKIVFEKPYYNIVIDGPGFVSQVLAFEDDTYFALEDDTFLEIAGEYLQGVNSVTVQLAEPGPVTITGFPWINSQQSFPASVLPRGASLEVANATLVNAERAPALLERLRQYHLQRYVQEMNLLPASLKPGDTVLSGTYYARKLMGAIHRQVLNLSGGFLMETVIRGIEFLLVPPMENPYRRPRSGVAICGADLTRQNLFREYA